MHAAALSTALFALLSPATAAPTKRDAVYHGIGLYFVTDVPGQRYQQSPAPIEINKLTDTYGGTASAIKFDTVAANIALDKVECRAFSDTDGVVPLGKPFHSNDPVVFSTTELVSVGSILCYVTTDKEVAEF